MAHMETKDEHLTNRELEEIRALLMEKLLHEGLEKTVPASAAQRRLWFIDQLEPNTPRYNIPSVVWLTGKLEVDALEGALKRIVGRHEVLRARFINEDGEPAQVIEDEESFELRQEDFSSCPQPERDAEVEQLIREEVKRPFDLSERLIRATLLRVSAEEHVLIINMHHIVSDEWSYKVFYRELKSFYCVLAQGMVPDLPELPIQYSDYAVWEREWLESEQCQEQLSYWKEKLAGNPPIVKLPSHRPRVAKVSPKGAVEVNVLPPEIRKGFHGVTVRQRATFFMVLLAAFKALLYRVSGQEDIIVGSPMAGRTQAETEHLIGFFANTLPVRTRISGETPFEELLVQVRKAVIGAFSNQDVPLEKIVDEASIDARKFPEENLERPFITNSVMHHYDQHMLVRVKPGQGNPQ